MAAESVRTCSNFPQRRKMSIPRSLHRSDETWNRLDTSQYCWYDLLIGEMVNIEGVHYMENGNTWGKTTVFPQSKMGVFSAVLIGKL